MLLPDEEIQEIQRGFTRFPGDVTDIDEGKAIAKAHLKKVVEWGEEWCPHTTADDVPQFKRECDKCWQALQEDK